MRHFIDIVNEAFKPIGPARAKRIVRPVVNTTRFKADLMALMRDLAAWPFELTFKQDGVAQVNRMLAAREALEREHAGPQDGPIVFDPRDFLAADMDEVWQQQALQSGLYDVRRAIEHEHDAYQERAAKRHGYGDDSDNYIESSDYLSAMDAMKQCANDLQMARSFDDPATLQRLIGSLQRFVSVWKEHCQPRDGGEEPILSADFADAIERLLPLLCMLAR